jgi:AraC family transcriptional regulator
MESIEKSCRKLKVPENFFKGRGSASIPTPFNILLFARQSKNALQQTALQNRSHHRFVLIFNLGAGGHVHTDHLSLPFSPGKSLLIHPYQFHHFSQLESNELLWLFCTFELPNNNALDLLRDKTVPFRGQTKSTLSLLVNEWLQQDTSKFGDDLLQATLLRLLLCLLQDQNSSSQVMLPETDDSLLRTINRLMTLRQQTPCTVARLANALQASESQVRRQFKQAAGVSLGRYIQNYRLNRAMSLLRNTTLSMADVAEQAGFGSPQAFSRTFKKETGQTPWDYRQESFPGL